MSNYAHFHNQLREALPRLPKTLRNVATYMLECPGDIATLSMRQLAAKSNVSLANFSRLAKEFGYDTYGELREIYRERVQQGNILEYHVRAEHLQKTGERIGGENIWAEFRDTAQENITSVYNKVDYTQIMAAVEALKPCQKIYVTGMQASRSAATYLAYIGGMTSPQFQLVGRTGGILADDLTDLSDQDALIAIAMNPCARSTVEIAMIAQERGSTVIGITDTPASPLAMYSSLLLISPNKSPLFFESYIGITAIIEMLVGMYTVGQNSSVVDRIEKIEASRLRLHENWDN